MNKISNITVKIIVFGIPCLATLGSSSFAIDENSIPIPVPNERKTQKQEPLNSQKETIVNQSVCPAVLSGQIIATILPPISDGQCGERSPLQINAFGSVELSAPIVVNCRMASSVSKWVANAERDAIQILGEGLTQIDVSTSYQCRRRNNAAKGKISEHGFANALDITAFRFKDGSVVTLSDGWEKEPQDIKEETDEKEASKESVFLKQVRDNACRYFTTVLSPEANKLHEDHFHFDMGCHGKTCTYKICE